MGDREAAFGLVGAEASGRELARRAAAAGLDVVGLRAPALEAVEAAADCPALAARLAHPRVVVLALSPGAPVDEAIEALYVHLEPGDIVVDASASYWGDSIRRYRRMRHRSLFYVDLALLPGTGQVLVAGDERGIGRLQPALGPLALPAGLVHAGPSGAAHFARLVRIGLEAAALELARETDALLDSFPAAATTEPDPIVAPPEELLWLLEDIEALAVEAPLLREALSKVLAGRRPRRARRVSGFIAPNEEQG